MLAGDMRRLMLAAIPLALFGCDAPTAAPAASASAIAAPAPPPPPQTAAAPPAPPDVDVAQIQKALKCGGDARSGVCGVLAKMASCKAWDPIVPSGDGRWLGRGWVVEGAKTTDQVTMLRARRVPTSEVGPGQLGVRIAIADLPKQEGAAFEQADRALRALERADVPPKSSPTLEYVKQRTQWSEAAALRTAGGQVYALTSGGAYLCQSPGRAVLVAQRDPAHGASGDGLYAELWPTSW
jgi:hypothetical protein